MSLVVLSTVDYDPAGYVEIAATVDSNEGDAKRRVTRSATLDGGAAFNDFGFSEADRTIVVNWTPDRAVDAAVARLVQSHTRVVISIGLGVYLAAPETYRPGADRSTLRLLVASKLSS